MLAVRQNLVSKVLDLEKDALYRKYKERVGEIMTGEVYQIWKKELLVLDEEGKIVGERVRPKAPERLSAEIVRIRP